MATVGINFGIDARTLAPLAALAAKHGASRNSVMPVLSSVLLTQDGDSLTLEATDLRHAVRLRVVGFGDGAGAVCVNADSLAALVGRLADDGTLSIRFDDAGDGAALVGRMQLRAGSSGAELPVIGAADFPVTNWGTDAETAVTIGGGELRRLLAVGGAAVASDDNRPALGGVRMVGIGECLRAESADGFRAAWAETSAVHGVARGLFYGGLTIHRDSVAVLRAHLADGQQVRLSLPTGQAGRLIAENADGAWCVALSLVDAAFPDLSRVWPAGDKASVTTDPGSWRRALAFMGAAQPSGITPQVRVKVSSMDGVTLSTHPAPESVAATTQVRAALAAGFSGETETALNARLLGGLIDALAASGVEDVTIALVIGDKRAPVTIDSVVNETMTASACLMPMTTTAA